MTADRAVLALADMLCAGADDEHIVLRRPDADRLARRAVELMLVAGWKLVHDPDTARSQR